MRKQKWVKTNRVMAPAEPSACWAGLNAAEQYVDIKTIKAFLRCSTQTIKYWIEKHGMPCRLCTRCKGKTLLLFKITEVDDWITTSFGANCIQRTLRKIEN